MNSLSRIAKGKEADLSIDKGNVWGPELGMGGLAMGWGMGEDLMAMCCLPIVCQLRGGAFSKFGVSACLNQDVATIAATTAAASTSRKDEHMAKTDMVVALAATLVAAQSNVKPISRNVSKGAAFYFRAVFDGLHDDTNGDTPPAKDRAAAAVNATPNPSQIWRKKTERVGRVVGNPNGGTKWVFDAVLLHEAEDRNSCRVQLAEKSKSQVCRYFVFANTLAGIWLVECNCINASIKKST
ncbi:hypothetical protein Tco_1245002 [Tanacetum coccineum]